MKMSHDSNTSQFVRTYGKPRRTQRLGQDSLWHDDLTDDFDKFFAPENVQQTTFISPEPTGPVSVIKHTIKKNKMKSGSGWSQSLQSTLTNPKSLATKKRNFECSSAIDFNKKTPLLKKTEMKKKYQHLTHTSYSSDTDSDTSNNLKVIPRFICRSSKKTKKQKILPKNQCSTPYQRSLFAYGKQFNRISSKKKSKKTKLKGKSDCTFMSPQSPKLSKKLDCSHINISKLKFESKEKHNQLEQSTLISSSCFPLVLNKQLNSKNKHGQNAIDKSKKACKLSNKASKSNKGKKNQISIGGHSGWFESTKNIFLSPEKSLKNHNNSITKSLEHQAKVSLKSLSPEDIYGSTMFINKSNDSESGISHNVSIKIDHRTFETPNTYILSDGDKSKLTDDSLHVLFSQDNENKTIEISDSSKYVVCVNNISVSENNENFVDMSTTTGHNSSQLGQFVTSSYNNDSDYLIQNDVELPSLIDLCDNTNELFTKSIDIKSPNILKQKESIKLNDSVNQTENTLASFRSNDNELVISISDSEPQNMSYTTINISNVTFLDEINQSSNLLLDKSTLNHNNTDSLDIKLPIILKQKESNMLNNHVNDNQTLHLLTEDISLQSSDNKFIKTLDSESNENCISSSEDENLVTIIENNVGSNDTQEKTMILPKILNNCSNNEQLSNHKICVYQDVKTENELSNFRSSCFSDKENFQSNCCESSILSNQIVCAESDFENMSSIAYEKVITTKDETSTYDDTFDDYLIEETSASNLRRKRYANRYSTLISSKESVCQNDTGFQNSSQRYSDFSFCLKPGKKWRRSIVIVRNYIDGNLHDTSNFTENSVKGRKWISTVDDLLQRQSICTNIYQKYEQSIIHKNSISRFSQVYSNENEVAKEYILENCNPKKPISFESWLEPKNIRTMKKVGEGVYGEVFSYRTGTSHTVVKIIPIEGECRINNERQKMMFEVYSEVLIAIELNKLFDENGWNHTKSFCKLKNISCVKGKYPAHLIELWEEFNAKNELGSNNDNPYILPDTQMFMVLEMEDGGVDVEHFVFNSASQALFAFLQIVFGLAAAELQFNFEHRDLHIGNILVKKVSFKTQVSFKLHGETFKFPSSGVKITIIDFTLSRITHHKNPVYNDLSKDPELFDAVGDYQFEIYRLMKNETNDQWNLYRPKTNIYWLHYILDKMINEVNYRNKSTAKHATGLNNLEKLKNSILSFDCVHTFAKSNFVLDFCN